MADSVDHVFRITWSVGQSNGASGNAPEPVDPVDVSLSLELSTGAIAQLEPVPGTPGEYRVQAVVGPLQTVRLLGHVAGVPVQSTVRVPGALTISSPAADTVRSPGGGASGRSVPFAWQAFLAGGYFAAPAGAASFPVTAISGEIRFPSLGPDTVGLTILALDSVSASFYAAGNINPPRGNLPGLLGVFGAATSASRVFIWE